MTYAVALSFRPDMSIREAPPHQVALVAPGTTVLLKDVTPGLATALRILSSTGASEDALSRLVRETDGGLVPPSFYYRLRQWARLGLLCFTLVAHERPIVTVMPMTAGFEPPLDAIDMDTRVCLSRFAYCRREGRAMVLESPLSLVRTILVDGGSLALVGGLTEPRSGRELCAIHDDFGAETVQAFLGLLVGSGVLSVVAEDGRLAEQGDPALRGWEFHDLVFHSRSRRGRHDQPSGATYHGAGTMDPLPAVKPTMTGDGIPLFEPDLDRLTKDDPPLALVVEKRRSYREQGTDPITARQVGEFLYRVARVRGIIEPDPGPGASYPLTTRPYPSGGGAYDLELYLTVDRCTNLPSGIYHYDALGHRLHKLRDRNANVEALLRDARAAAAMPVDPQILITLASRFGRLTWKYSGLAYALALKNVGVLFQTMYLAATAMGLAACALGGGDSELFAAATGIDPFEEPTVGEFILGSMPTLESSQRR